MEIRKDGIALLGCRGHDGEPLIHCSKAGNYRDSALPLSEQMCRFAIDEHSPHMNDTYKQPYVDVCHELDETLADPHKAGSAENLRLRFDAMERELEEMISNPDLAKGDNGRYLYHIDARTIYAFLPAFWHRAEYGNDEEMPQAIVDDTYQRIVDILDDFSGIYDGVANQVALRRTEIEILALLLRTKSFPYPTLFREDASETRAYNHDAYVLYNGKKIAIQITNADYRLPNGKQKSESYDPEMIIAIHQRLVNLDYVEKETIVTTFDQLPKPIEHKHDISDKYEHLEEMPRYVAWGATSDVRIHDEAIDLKAEYVQEIGGKRRTGLVQALVKEARGQKVEPEQRNALNGASHYLLALIREKQYKIDS